MSKHKSPGKDKEKGGQLVIRVDKSDRAAFITQCEQLDTTAAREIRRFMREFIATHTPKDAVAAENAATDTSDTSAPPAAMIEPATPAPVAAEDLAAPDLAAAETAPAKKTRKRVKP